MTPYSGVAGGNTGSALPDCLAADMSRVEELLLATAGASDHPLVAEPSTHLIKAGGKRLRPALVLLSAQVGAEGGSTSTADVDGRATDLAAAAVELVHLATLYHDDVMDETEMRRGVPTTHSKWGVEVAVLAGDFLFACGSSLGADAGGEVPGILARAIAEVCEGQIVETAALGDPRRGVEEYLGTIARKTGALFRAACDLGSATGGVRGEERAALVSYGRHLGLAFQMVDDLLDLVGDPDVIGKMPGTDLKEGVFTYAVLTACERDEELAERIASGQRDLTTLLPAIERAGGLQAARRRAVEAADEARRELEALPDSTPRVALDGIVDAVLAQLP